MKTDREKIDLIKSRLLFIYKIQNGLIVDFNNKMAHHLMGLILGNKLRLANLKPALKEFFKEMPLIDIESQESKIQFSKRF